MSANALSEVALCFACFVLGVVIAMAIDKHNVRDMNRASVASGHAEWATGENGAPVFQWKQCEVCSSK